MALELIRKADPNYKGKTYRTRLDWFASTVGLAAREVRSILLNDGAKFDDPANIAPDSWFSIELSDYVAISKPGVREKSGIHLKPKRGKKIGRNIPADQLNDWNG